MPVQVGLGRPHTTPHFSIWVTSNPNKPMTRGRQSGGLPANDRPDQSAVPVRPIATTFAHGKGSQVPKWRGGTSCDAIVWSMRVVWTGVQQGHGSTLREVVVGEPAAACPTADRGSSAVSIGGSGWGSAGLTCRDSRENQLWGCDRTLTAIRVPLRGGQQVHVP